MTGPPSRTHELTDYLTVLAGQADEVSAINAAVVHAMAMLNATLCAAVVDGAVIGYTGPTDAPPPSGLVGLVGGVHTLDIEGVGALSAAVSSTDDGTAVADADECPPGSLVVARHDQPFGAEDLALLDGMAQALGITLRGMRQLATGRTMIAVHERDTDDRLRLLTALGTRQRMLETVLRIQRSIADRHPLQDILDAVTGGAASLLDRAGVALVVPGQNTDQLTYASYGGRQEGRDDPLMLTAAGEAMHANRIVARTETDRSGGTHGVIATPITVRGVVAASLAAEAMPEWGHVIEQRELLTTFAQQVSLALTEARITDAIHNAHHDAVTGLPNRTLFLERVSQAITEANMRLTDLTVLLVDIHRFKSVNDSLGHRAGDAVLSAVTERIRSVLRGSDLVARVGGDEFGVLLEGAGTQTGARVARSVIDAIRAPVRVSGRSVHLTACVGLASCRTTSAESGDLFNCADLAMNRAIAAGPGRIEVYEPHMHAEILERINLLDDLQLALARTQVRLQYQPLIDLATNRPIGVEALARWRHPERGDVSPMTFIPLAEETGLILDLGSWILREGCRQIAEWRRFMPDMRLNINISARQAMDPAFVDRVTSALSEMGLPGDVLTLELTESMLMGDPDQAMAQLRQLKNHGIRLSIDDFGTGYSSLSYLRQFPVDQLKIDQTFVTGAATNEDQLAVTRTVMDLGRTLRLETVAEGIEDTAQLELLRTIGCDLGQGYLLARPMEPSAIREFFTRLSASDGSAAHRQAPPSHARQWQTTH